MPSPCRANALRSDGQVVPNSAAAALMLPSRWATWKARSASPPVGEEAAGLPAHRSAEASSEHTGLRGQVRRTWGMLGRTTGSRRRFTGQ